MSQCKVCHQKENVIVLDLSPVGEFHSVRLVTNRRMSQCKACYQ